jgi:hypothetical protein
VIIKKFSRDNQSIAGVNLQLPDFSRLFD